MKQIASRYEKNSVDIDPLYLVMDTPKDTLQVFIQFEQKDKNGITVLNHFDFIMKESFVKRYNESIFSVAHISQGGSCLEHGKSGLVSAKQEELKEYLSSDPNGIHFLNYFSPRAFHKIEDNMFSDIDTNNLPNSWLMTISDSAEIKVCQGEESVEYTPGISFIDLHLNLLLFFRSIPFMVSEIRTNVAWKS
uniref:Glycosyltransferase family 92 protein n=1 Tax=Caenorhabditis tropicalis TaxID=1561998 RepID=A0A1I7V558_9PELO